MIVLQEAALEVLELRRYVMRPGRRDDLIALFEREFIESQEACGMLPLGHYRDLDDPQSFVWFRGFTGMHNRRRALEAFYLESPAWLNNRDAANATMVDSGNVLLLRPALAHRGFDLRGLARPGAADAPDPGSYVGVAVFMLSSPASPALVDAFESGVVPELERHARRIAVLVTDQRPNDFPRLPVRSGEHALVIAGSCANADDLGSWMHVLQARLLRRELPAEAIACEYLRLQPAARALFR